ncbi:hypothetical protein CEUSTIGMA_g4706.t1 [Chlamydomonas eustigma]|uniref:DUF92 domain-containing protein n=1 Tax=Chlamydomonas eustigma TaxID=1157962 RepID=A0A250X3B1_9CHLO|nr:hypothetical protein CEUSTIGMA_g4706.t1 [Chlamydomonas eustigma]|eukprot:GAX77260.1 hypothetical protein CEUSTIGMA_g4706.t1 [Chlamydomonas eustigma]
MNLVPSNKFVISHRLHNRSHTSKLRTSIPQTCHATLPIETVKEFLTAATTPHPGLLYGTAANTIVFTFGFPILRKGLTVPGVANAWLLGASVWSAFGAGGYLLLCLYFILGTLVTKVKLKQKQAEGIAEARSGLRGPGSVWGSGSAAAACALLSIMSDDPSLWQVGFVASICSKLSDTFSSEIGKAYGKTTYLVTTFELVPRGTEGAVSLEGTLAGIVAAFLFAAVAIALGQVTVGESLVVGFAAVAANTFESYLGASVQGRLSWLTNDLVNVLQITLAAIIAICLSKFCLVS